MKKQQDQQQTAKIYAFPSRPRTATAKARDAVMSAQQTASAVPAEYGRGWYHQAAIEEAEEAYHQQH
jgi:hypothetical protein